MNDYNVMKEVYFDQYCKNCVNVKLKDIEDPCNECLTEPVNLNSHKPLNYIKNEHK